MADHITIGKAPGTWVARAGGRVVAKSASALELREGTYPPVVYFPRADADMELLERTDRATTCPWKGQASYYSIVTSDSRLDNAIWSYETPKDDVAPIAGHLAFYPDKVAVERV